MKGVKSKCLGVKTALETTFPEQFYFRETVASHTTHR